MNSLRPERSLIVLAVVLCSWFVSTACRDETVAGDDSMQSYEAQLRQEEKARAADPAWRASTERALTIKVGDLVKDASVHNFCLDGEQRLLVCCGSGNPSPKDAQAALAVISSEGKLIEKWALPSTPEAVCVDQDGAVFVGGAGRILKLDRAGKSVGATDTPAATQTVSLEKAALEKMTGQTLSDEEATRYRQIIQERKLSVTGIAATGNDVFVACPSLTDFTFCVYRYDRDLKNPTQVVKGLRGCCGQMDIQAKDGKLWVAHNARHLVESYDRDGKKLTSFGKSDRKAADGFGGCCEPKNLRLGSDGNVYAAESGPPVAIKRYSTEGKFGGVVAAPSYESSCVRTTVEVSPDCKRFFLLDTGANAIHVFAARR